MIRKSSAGISKDITAMHKRESLINNLGLNTSYLWNCIRRTFDTQFLDQFGG